MTILAHKSVTQNVQELARSLAKLPQVPPSARQDLIEIAGELEGSSIRIGKHQLDEMQQVLVGEGGHLLSTISRLQKLTGITD